MPDTKRADAQRNYEQVLAAARAAFAEHGTDASLRDVARRAGVGIGTLYRHFPTREALLEALLRDRFDNLREHAGSLADADDTRAALLDWLARLAAGSTTYRGLPDSVLSALRDKRSSLHAACEAMRTAGRDLLRRAQHADTVRDTVTIEDLLVLATGVAWAAQQSPRPEATIDHLLGYLADGI